MLNKKLLGSISKPPSDANFENVSLLLSGDGTNGAQNNTFLDSSTNNFTITRNGNTTQGSFSPYGSNWSNYFPGTSYLNTATNGTAFAMGTGDYTIEGWGFKSDSTDDVGLFGTEATGIRLYWYGGILYHQCGLNSTGGSGVTVSETAPSLNTWFHWACVRSSGTIRLYINGVSTTSTGSATANINSTYMTIGREMVNYTNYYWVGNISNVRAVKGTAVYTSNFTPSTTPLTAISGTSLLTCQSNRFIDNSSNAFALTVNGTPSVQRFSPFNPTAPYSTSVIGGSGYFDGTGDYLSVPNNSALDLSGDFTIDCWYYGSTLSGEQCIFHNYNADQRGVSFHVNGIYPRILAGNGSWFVVLDSSIGISANTWNYIAATRSGSTWTIWVNGVSGGTASSASTPSFTTDPTTIGRFTSGTPLALGGYLSDLRVVKGTALTITVPTAPLSAVSGTSLLTKYQNAGIPDLAMQNNLETVGNAQVSTSVKKYGTGSLAFDGSGDYLQIVNNNIFDTNGTFTLECWIYQPSSGDGCFVGRGGGDGSWSASNGHQFLLFISGGTLYWMWNTGGGGNTSISTSAPASGQWHHLAVGYNGTTTRFWLNGTSLGTSTTGYTMPTTRNIIRVGLNPSNESPLNGYIDDLRFTKGIDRYGVSNSTITPPASALPTY